MILYLRNLGLWLNLTVMTLIGQDPRKTISAFVELNHWRARWIRALRRLLDRIYPEETLNGHKVGHCEYAAQGWDMDSDIIDRSLWWAVIPREKRK